MPEFVGSEKRIRESIIKILKSKDIVILVEKMNIKWIASVQVAVDYHSKDYQYLQLLDSLAMKTSAESRFFTVYHTK